MLEILVRPWPCRLYRFRRPCSKRILKLSTYGLQIFLVKDQNLWSLSLVSIWSLNRSRSLESPVNCSAIVMIIGKPNFHFASNRQRSQWLPTIATITITGTESESTSAIVAIVNDRQRSQKVNGNHQCSDCSDRNDRNDPSDHMETIAQRSQWSWRSQQSNVFCDLNDPSDYMETKLLRLWRSLWSNVFSDHNDPSDRNDRQRSYGN